MFDFNAPSMTSIGMITRSPRREEKRSIPGGITNGEGIRTEHMDLSWLTAIEFSHALHICKGNKITVLKIMTSFKNRDGAFLVLQMIEKGRAYVHDVADYHGFGILAVLVLNNKIISKIAEDFSANTGGVGTNEANVVGVADGIQANLLCCIQKGINNNLTVGEMRRRIL